MNRWREHMRAWCRTEAGSEVAQAAAVALMAAVLVGALLTASNTLGPKTQQAFACLASTLSGGGGASCGEAATADQAAAQPPAPAPEQKEEKKDCGWNPVCHAKNLAEKHGGKILDGVQVVLDVGGLVPGLGEPLDLLNGTISLARGNYVDAALSYGSAVPFVGWAGTAAKWGKRGVDAVNAADAVNDTRKTVDRANDARKAIDGADEANDVRKGVDGANDAGRQADDGIPPCPIGATPGRHGSGLATVAQNTCDNMLKGGRKVQGFFPDTAGPNEVLYRVNPQTGNVSHYQVYDADGLPLKRVDLEGRPHGGVPTPHVLEYTRNTNPKTGEVFVNKPKTVRPARPDEIPTTTP